MYSPYDSSDDVILSKAKQMSLSWVSGWVEGTHRHMIRSIIEERGLDFDPKKVVISPPPNQLLPLLKSEEKVIICNEQIQSEQMWFRPFSDNQPHSLSFDFNFSPLEYSVKLIIDETVTLHYESLIVHFSDDCNNLIGLELLDLLLMYASVRDIRFVWINLQLNESEPDEYDLLSRLIDRVTQMPNVFKILITGTSPLTIRELLKYPLKVSQFSTIEELRVRLK